MKPARIESENGNIVFYSPYDAGLVADFKARIPAADRSWDRELKRWLVAPSHLGTLEILCEMYSIPVVKQLRTLYDAPPIVQRILEVRYIGAPKEREDGSFTAMGNVGGQWSVVFPQSVLRGWFELTPQDASPAAAMTYYGVLNVKRDADGAAIKAAYRQMAKRWHPDINRDPDATEMFKRIGAAYEVLSDGTKRRRYDAGLALEASLQQADRLSSRRSNDNHWRPPLRCGWLLVEGVERLGRVVVSKIHQWQPIVDSYGRELVTSWPMGADSWLEAWV